MLITIENFGAIKYFQFDTDKDLYLLFGKNSVGKSYAISLVYLILKNLKESKNTNIATYETRYFFNKNLAFSEDEKNVKGFSEELEKNRKECDEIQIYKSIKRMLIKYLNNSFLNSLNESILNTFNDLENLQNQFTVDKLKITIALNSQKSIDLKFTIFLDDKENFSIKELEFDNKFILINKELNVWLQEEDMYVAIIDIINNHCSITNYIYYLPASRSGLYHALGAFGQIFVELSKSRNFISKPITIPAIAEPMADYFLHLSNIKASKQLNRDFIDYVNEIEKEILQGIVTFDNERKKLFFTPNNTSLKLDLSATSSMVSEISAITSYIKYIFTINRSQQGEQKPIVFIEEPEAHLHPETQVKLMAVFARMVKDNKIKLVMTSHSNYIFNKASNLVIDNKIDKEKFKAVLFDMTEEGSIARELETDEYGIEDENFIDTAESIYQEKIELINKLNG